MKPAATPRVIEEVDVIIAAENFARNARDLSELVVRLKPDAERSDAERKAVNNARLALLIARAELLRVAKAFT